MNGYTKWEWRILKVGFFSMTGLALPFALGGSCGSMIGNHTMLLAGAGGLVVAAAIGGATVIALRIMANRPQSWYLDSRA